MCEKEQVKIADLMAVSGVKFGTSGARGLAVDMTDRVCYAYVTAFISHLQTIGEIEAGSAIVVAGDLRPSTPRIMAATAMAITDAGYQVIHAGFVPTPAVTYYAMQQGIASLMVTGSHIPDDRNGIKFNKPSGEILKTDEEGIAAQLVTLDPSKFDEQGASVTPHQLPAVEEGIRQQYIHRYLDFFPDNCLAGSRVAVYQHSSVAREVLVDIFAGLGAEVVCLGYSEIFIPVDTEAIRPEDVQLAKQWAEQNDFDCIVSADGDGDRPLVSDEQGNWLRGDVAGVLCARALGAQSVATPVSSNSAVDKCGWFKQVDRTRIGSPFVIAAMENALQGNNVPVVGYEANGGFLIASDIISSGKVLKALPTRDAVIVPLTILQSANAQGCKISTLLSKLPARFTYSDRLKAFPTALSQSKIASLNSGDFAKDKAAIEATFKSEFGTVNSLDNTDGLRITFDSEEVVHLRPSGNAPELRCYNEAASGERVEAMNRACMNILESWRE